MKILMYGDSIFKVIINSIKNFFKIIATLVATAVTSIFGYKKNEEAKKSGDALAAEMKNIQTQMEQFKMPPHNFLRAGAALITGRLSFNRMFDLVTKYIGGWGEQQITYRFEGYKDGECVLRYTKGFSDLENQKPLNGKERYNIYYE